jgi:hypothetical protein
MKQANRAKMKPLLLWVEPQVRKEFKSFCALKGVTMQAWVVRAIERALAKEEKGERVSTVSGEGGS